ncbi:hypothetical protein AVEN_74598-1 [Araneus ventricosus]|uniref:Uncharacterized protein n=1 Tax=Araneus ventricosus TaxID=182803 RepID=A0A4Y2QND2_ARAVE|nr:hypothetical protein AVEN_192869-1 [Araneus ventricosus]GBN64845.1 hypothetical protein AVEN_74598-1 [Araneus ventricosus]
MLLLLSLHLSKWDSPPRFLKTHFPSLLFVVFAFAREPRSPSPRSHFSFMTHHSKRIKTEDEIRNFSTAPRQFSSDLHIDEGFWNCVERSHHEYPALGFLHKYVSIEVQEIP